jgi:hypothetical protein
MSTEEVRYYFKLEKNQVLSNRSPLSLIGIQDECTLPRFSPSNARLSLSSADMVTAVLESAYFLGEREWLAYCYNETIFYRRSFDGWHL